MISYYIKEWTMRLLVILAIVGTLWGCQSIKTTETMGPMDSVAITPEAMEEEKALEDMTFIEALRYSCLKDGSFTLVYKSVREWYSCERIDG